MSSLKGLMLLFGHQKENVARENLVLVIPKDLLKYFCI